MITKMQHVEENVYSFCMGELKMYLLSDGNFNIGNPQPIIAPDIEKNILRNELRKMGLPDGYYEAPIIVLLIQKGNEYILIDTGEGDLSSGTGVILKSISVAGVSPEDITAILISHAHQDHIGGILTEEGRLNFPNARYFISGKEWEFWTADHLDFSESRLPLEKCPDGKYQKNIFSRIKERLHFWVPGEPLFSCIMPEDAPGHTPGHTIFRIFSEEEQVLYSGDVLHSPLLVRYPDWGTQWDIDFKQGVETRKKILEDCCQTGILTISAHLPWPGIGYIGQKEEKWTWEAGIK
ncbi:MBL fold metallo-hydrolase [Chryseobacterium sp.]|uniref:MBL fold metallo-hydrolase n=1 Tax=Chryseobacterium sp. TaxID=1871047 RepID=UPI003341E06A